MSIMSDTGDKHRPRVLLLGDSIRMSYQDTVAGLLKDRADVVGPAENCQFSTFALDSLGKWLGELGTPDIVHWNNGIHDSGHNPERSPVQIPLETYVSNLRTILARLCATGAAVIWATSTPVHPDRPFRDDQWSWRNEEIDKYNSAAYGVVWARGVPINDLHALVASNHDLYLADDMLHLSEAGVEACGAAAAVAIGACLDEHRLRTQRGDGEEQ
jgi:hypothetical protein